MWQDDAAWPFQDFEASAFPRQDLEASRHDEDLQARNRVRVEETKGTHQQLACPDCECGSRLSWFYFRSPPWTWRNLCGRAGVIVYCDEHERQVAFFMDLMS